MGDPLRIRDGDDRLGRALARVARRRPALPDDCRARFYWAVQRESVQRPRRFVRQLPAAALGLTAAAVVWALVVFAGPGSRRDVEVLAGAPSSIAAQSAVCAGDAEASSNRWRRLEVPEVGTLEVSPDSDFGFSAVTEGRVLTLNRGLLRAQVVHQDPFAPLSIVTPHLVVEVIGTRVDIYVEPRRTRVDLLEGRVRVQGADASVLLSAGESIESDDPRFAAPVAPPSPAAPSGAGIEAKRRPQLLRIALRAKPVFRAVPEQVLVDDCDRQQSPESKQRCLRSLAHADGLAGQNALLSLAMLAADGAEVAAALPYLDEYEARFPAGALAAEVALKRIEVLLRLEWRVQALQAARAFTQRFGSHARAVRVELLRAQLLCAAPEGRAEGLEILDRLAAGPDPATRGDAARLHARCSSTMTASPRGGDDSPPAPPGGQSPGD